MKLTSLLQLVGKLQKAGKIDNLQQVCGVFGCVTDNSDKGEQSLVSSLVTPNAPLLSDENGPAVILQNHRKIANKHKCPKQF